MNNIRLITSNLIYELRTCIDQAESIYWIVAFAMKSGVSLVLPKLKEAAARGVEIKILVGNYLYITQPEALKLLIQELPEAEIRLYENQGSSFHPKAYLFRTKENSHVFIGSSNISASALQNGVEWNIHAPLSLDNELFEDALSEFMIQFLSPYSIQLNKERLSMYEEGYIKANELISMSQMCDANSEVEMMFGTNEQQEEVFEKTNAYIIENDPLTPRPVQQLALDALQQTRDEDYDKALVVLATGLGKTYLAAFFAQEFKKVLFIAHREEILVQAKESFRHVHHDKSTGIYNGFVKDREADFVFASIFTLAADYHLKNFKPDEFDLIVVDEFHHATAPTYEKILNYFTPDFLLGITATPDRLDNKDVYSLCDGNVAISINFLEAIKRNWLSPFMYYGVYDETDYSGLQWRNNRYDEKELLALQIRYEYADAVLQAWELHKQHKTIAFCSSVKQAIYLSNHFNNAGYQTIALHGQSERNHRESARQYLESGKIDVIFTVDLFNEGVDIPSVDTLLFIRPTESLTIFTQQIGRGLRISEGKTHCTIIDLIGNYRNADMKLRVFTEDNEEPKSFTIAGFDLPEECHIHFDTEVVSLFNEMQRKRSPRKEQLAIAYQELKLKLGYRPSYLEFHLKANADSKAIKQEFDSYPGLLAFANELSEQEEKIYQKYKQWFIEVNGTIMTKSYKMVVLKYALSLGSENWLNPITPEDTAPFFHQYLTKKDYRRHIDFSDKQGEELLQFDEKKIASLIARMPMTKWHGSSNGLIAFKDNLFSIQIDISDEDKVIIYNWTKEICEYRLHSYFERKALKLQ